MNIFPNPQDGELKDKDYLYIILVGIFFLLYFVFILGCIFFT